jgi:hypothetical protein
MVIRKQIGAAGAPALGHGRKHDEGKRDAVERFAMRLWASAI